MAPWRRPDSGVIDYSPIHISKMVLPTVNLGPTTLDKIKNFHAAAQVGSVRRTLVLLTDRRKAS